MRSYYKKFGALPWFMQIALGVVFMAAVVLAGLDVVAIYTGTLERNHMPFVVSFAFMFWVVAIPLAHHWLDHMTPEQRRGLKNAMESDLLGRHE